MSATLAGTLPGGDGNGLAAIAADLVAAPKKVRVVVALIDVVKVVKRVDDDTLIPTVRIRRIEAIANPDDRDVMHNLLQREFERRTGQTVLPFELETDVRSALADDRPEDGDDS